MVTAILAVLGGVALLIGGISSIGEGAVAGGMIGGGVGMAISGFWWKAWHDAAAEGLDQLGAAVDVLRDIRRQRHSE